MFSIIRKLWATVGIAMCLATLVGCGDDSSGGGGGTPIAVTVEEYKVTVTPNSAPSGKVTFTVTNNGDETHEFVVFETDLAPDALPLKNGAVDEEGAGVKLIDELDEIPAGDSQTLTVTLAAGKHVLVCNRTEDEPDGGVESHYRHGMRAAFTVK